MGLSPEDGGVKERIKIRPKFDDFAYSATISCIFTIASSSVIGWSYAPVILPMSIVASMLWGRVAFALACITTIPIAVVIIWLYALIEVAGYGLNMITVSIAAISLGVGIDYVHVIEKVQGEMEASSNPSASIKAVGGASGLALVGSALSDMAGFLVIMQSSMGFFSTFGLFCAVMIGLALVASMVLAPAAARERCRWVNPPPKDTDSANLAL